MSDPMMQRTVATPPRTRDVIYDVDTTTMVTPKDRIRWAAVLAGIFTSMATMIFLTVLGIAVGFSAFDPGDPAGNVLALTSIYGIVSGLISFFVGGWVAARTAAVGGRDNGFLHGAMVWIASIVLLVNVFGLGMSALLGTAVNAATDAASVAGAAAANEAVDAAQQGTLPGQTGADTAANPADPNAAGAAQDPAAQVGEQINQAAQNVNPQDVEQAADTVSRGAWMALLGMGLTMLAAALGGIAGARRRYADTDYARSAA